MRKNNKGFTLIEIIAVVAILGILVMITMPNLLNLVTNSKDEIYVQDAKKLIAQAQYVMKKRSTEIDKPLSGDYIALSLNYIGTTGFTSPPNGGEYLKEASFVVVKNIQDPDSDIENYKYSVVLVEATDDGFYRGIKMSSEEQLGKETAKTLVTYFTEDEIVYIDEDSAINNSCTKDSCVMSEEYINKTATDEKMKSEDGTIIGTYNVVITKNDEEEQESVFAPNFTAKAVSDLNNLYSLTGKVHVFVNNAENISGDLKVCIGVSDNKNGTYPEVSDASVCETYVVDREAGEIAYVHEFDLGKEGFDYKSRQVAYFYIVVADKEGNNSRKKISYEIHENLPPSIKTFRINKHQDNKTSFNMPYVYLTTEVSDDFGTDDLTYCIIDSLKEDDNKECKDYHDYNYYFDGNNKFSFKDSNGKVITLPVGGTHFLTLYVKDREGLITSKRATMASSVVSGTNVYGYTIYKNQKPKLSVTLEPKQKSISGYKAANDIKDVGLKIEASDDMTDDSRLMIKIGDNNPITYSTYKPTDSPFRYYTFPGEYDGKSRKLTITATDEYGEVTSVEATLNNVYTDSAPIISVFDVASQKYYISRSFELNSNGEKIKLDSRPENCVNGNEQECYKTNEFACSSCDSIVKNGIIYDGSYSVEISANITDDLTSLSDLKACITTDKNGCKKDSDFDSASKIINSPFVIPSEWTLPYKDENTVTLTLYVKDEKNHITSAKKEYHLYKNKKPTVTVSDDNIISAGSGDLNIGSVYLKNSVNIVDDFNDYDVEFCYLVKDKEHEKEKPKVDDVAKGRCTKISRDSLKSTIEFTFRDENNAALDYDNQTIYTIYKVKDGYGEKANSNVVEYKLSQNKEPEIVDFTVESSAKDEAGKVKYNSVLFSYSFTVYDPNDTFTTCITTLADPDRCDYEKGRANFKGDANNIPYTGGVNRIIKGEYKVSDFNSYTNGLIWNPGEEGNWKYSTNVEYVFNNFYQDSGIIGEHDIKRETLLFVVADSRGAIAKKEYTYVPRYSCSIHKNNDEIEAYEQIKKIEENEDLTPEQKAEEKAKIPHGMDVLEEGELESISISEALNRNPTINTKNTVNSISPENCGGLCYEDMSDDALSNIGYHSESIPLKNDIKAFYSRAISYTDKLVQDEIKKFGLEDFVCSTDEDGYNLTLESKLGCARPTCLDDSIRYSDGEEARENNFLISLHLFGKNKTWTYANSGSNYINSRIPYQSICVEPEAQRDILFSKYDYRLGMDMNFLCNRSVYEEKCTKVIEKDYIEDYNPEKRDCSNIEPDYSGIPERCSKISFEGRKIYPFEDPQYCSKNFEKYMDEKIRTEFHKYDGRESEMPKEVADRYNDAIEVAKETCKERIDDEKIECNNIYADADNAAAEERQKCNNYNTIEIPEMIADNEAKKKKYIDAVSKCADTDKDKCIAEINGYANINPLEGKLLDTTCEDVSEDVYCDTRLFDGNCKQTNCTQDEVDEDGNPICMKKCYKSINCSESSKSAFQLQFVCHGYFKLYRSRRAGNKIVVEDTGMRVCPEVLSSRHFANDFKYTTERRFIKFFPNDFGGVISE